ncbi:MAG: hypothetical protein RLZZ450_1546, partial [Pseudomonadota bacterium]
VGISCSACHAPHAVHVGRALVRSAVLPRGTAKTLSIADTTSGVCVACHAPAPDELVPSASSASLWLGELALPGPLGAEVRSPPSAHAQLADGCMSCHGERADPADTKTDHSFRVDPRPCRACHVEDRSDFSSAVLPLRARADEVLRRLEGACGKSDAQVSSHAGPPAQPCRTVQATRARYLALAVRSDGAAAIHNAPFARALLTEAERALDASR